MIDAILRPIELAVAWIMYGWHQVLSVVLPSDSGITWTLSIVGLVIVIRILLIPLFVRQINASRAMQLIQPEVRKIQQKYKGKTDAASRDAMGKEMMALYRDSKTNPFSSCLPILLQSPVFFALFRVLNKLSLPPDQLTPIGPLDTKLMREASAATLFGAPLSDTFMNADTAATKLVTVGLIALMCLSSFFTQRQLLMKNMPQSALEGPYMRQQKMMLYALPLVFAVSGVAFPLGVLVYWLTTNVWSMGQQFYVIRNRPAPGSAAEKAYNERRRKAGKVVDTTAAENNELEEAASKQRQQPKRQSRSKRKS